MAIGVAGGAAIRTTGGAADLGSVCVLDLDGITTIAIG